ncbi:52 kda repressor of the inhibitor of [Lynx pardinus]|uniref:52 kDa repressor of the inhibitor of n=1 Tax=Lynx pardinus TaxID=191816 RepID=A0A485NVL4_LYNPA|nr:52 kda repressor of the inhibitor of [Lynx pardinus]
MDETSEQEQKHKKINNSNAQNPSAEEGGKDQDEDILPLTLEEKENKEYFKHTAGMQCKFRRRGSRKLFETTAVNALFHSKTQQRQMLEVLDIAEEEHLPVLVSLVEESHNLREDSVAFVPHEADPESLAVKFHTALVAVLYSLNEVMENIEVDHEFWSAEATNVATKLDIQLKLPGKFRRAQQVERIIQELKGTFSEQHFRALKCLSLVTSVMGQLKFNTSEGHHADIYRSDLPNPDTLSAELLCWRIRWKHRGKDMELPSTIYGALHLQDIEFFPNVYALPKVLYILPVMKVENECYENGQKHLKAYLRNILTDQISSILALLNINFDIKHDLDLMVDTYIKLYTTKSELPTDISDTIGNT